MESAALTQTPICSCSKSSQVHASFQQSSYPPRVQDQAVGSVIVSRWSSWQGAALLQHLQPAPNLALSLLL